MTDPVPTSGEHYIAVPLEVLEALKSLYLEPEKDRISIGTVRLLLRSVRFDTINGQLVIGIRTVRHLDQPPRTYQSDQLGPVTIPEE